MRRPLVAVRNLSVRFGGVHALTDVSLDVAEGSTFGIIGPNGAGKTSLFNCISGFIRPAVGSTIELDGHDICGLRVDRIARMGVGRTFQNISLVRSLSVRENIVAGLHQSLPYGFLGALLGLPGVQRAEADARREVEAVADLLGISRRVLGQPAAALPLGMQKKVEVARALVRRPRLLLLDEPAGGLNDTETADLAVSLRTVMRAHALTIVLIDHDMSFVMPFCDEICVLNFGHRVACGAPNAVSCDPAVAECYLGDELAA